MNQHHFIVRLLLLKARNKNSIISRSILLLLITLCINSYAKFHDIYNVINPSFHYYVEGDEYKVILKNTGYVSLQNNGFRFYLPKLVKDYNLELLRVSSIGHLDGYLSNNKYINKKNVLNVSLVDLNYYLTDYNETNQRQLDYVMNDKIIPYKSVTSIVIEGHNIPLSISNNLDKWLYFNFEKIKDNPLKELSYTFNMTFDKYQVDTYVKRNLNVTDYSKGELVYIDAYFNNLTKKKINFQEASKKIEKKVKVKSQVRKEVKVKKQVKKYVKKKSKYYLDIKRISNYINITGLKNNKKELLNALNNPSDKKDIAKINFNLGVYYLRTNKKANLKKSLKYFKDSKLKEAYFNIGIFYYIGLYVKENDSTAYKYFKKSSDLGFLRGRKNKNIMEEYKVGVH